MTERLPLFPLGQPLFPGICLQLQIFEQRYLRLVRESMRDDSAFGIVAIADGREVGAPPETCEFGLEVKIVDWCQQENGLLGVAVSGTRRFQILSTTLEEDNLLVADVGWLDEGVNHRSIPAESLDGLKKLLRDLAQHPALNWVELSEQLSEEELGWKLAQVLPVSLDNKISLLADSDLVRRLEKIQVLVDELSST